MSVALPLVWGVDDADSEEDCEVNREAVAGSPLLDAATVRETDACTLKDGVSVGRDAFADTDAVAQPLFSIDIVFEADRDSRFDAETIAVPECDKDAIVLVETLGEPDVAPESDCDALDDGQPLWSGELVDVTENTEAVVVTVAEEETHDVSVFSAFVADAVPESDGDAE